MIVAVAPVTDISLWARGDGLEAVLVVLGALLLSRLRSRLRGRRPRPTPSGQA